MDWKRFNGFYNFCERHNPIKLNLFSFKFQDFSQNKEPNKTVGNKWNLNKHFQNVEFSYYIPQSKCSKFTQHSIPANTAIKKFIWKGISIHFEDNGNTNISCHI